MKDLIKALCLLGLILGVMFTAVILIRHLTKRTYITIEED